MHPALKDGSFEHLKLGRRPPKVDSRTLKLADYLDVDALPPLPGVEDLTAKVASWPMYGNDTLGDCTLAAAGHMIEAWTANGRGHVRIPSTSTIENAYFATGDHIDDGRVELDVLNYWRHHGIGRDKIGAYVALNPRNHEHVKAGIYLFGGVYTGIALPLTAQRQHVWDYVANDPGNAPGSWGGHAVPYEGYDESGVTLVTWGATLKATWAFNDRYTDEAYAILSPDWFEAGVSPAGLNQAALLADLNAIAH